jgi:hypothetical protein
MVGKSGAMKFEYPVHDFVDDLSWSELPTKYIVYLNSIIHWWPDLTSWERVANLLQQRKGNDIAIELSNGKLVNLQFKSRRKDYGDLCIEYRHDHRNGVSIPGWIEKLSDANYLIYCVPGKVFRIDYPSLHEAWITNRQKWIECFDLPPSPNRDYETRNVGIRLNILEIAGVKIDGLKFNSQGNMHGSNLTDIQLKLL